jgi:hypothetical protein
MVIQEERSVFWELIPSVLEKSSHEHLSNYEVLSGSKKEREIAVNILKSEFHVQMTNFLELKIIFKKSRCQPR